MKLDKSLAFQVVNTIKDTCGQDINFIDKQGMIFASTNTDRIGTFHAIGHKAAQTEQTIEVFSDDDFPGTQKGINMPLYYHGSFLAVIGITGDPDQVRQYVHLADRITHLLIREKELNRLSRSLEDKKHFVIDALIRNEIADPDYLDTCLSDLQVNPGTKKRLLIIQSSPDGHNRSSDFSARLVLLFIPFIIQMNILPCWKTPAKPLSIRYWLILPQTVELCSPLQSERNVSFSSCLFLTNLHSLR